MAITKKICLLGAPGVGKTSLLRRYVNALFSERYQTTVGVCIEKKVVTTPAGEIVLVLWDLAGDDEQQRLQASYLRGSSALLLVADGTRPETLTAALEIQDRVVALGSPAPFALALNKADLTAEWRLTDAQIGAAAPRMASVTRTSAKAGDAVESLFQQLALHSLKA